MREMSIYKRYCYYCTTDFQNGASTTAEGADGSFRCQPVGEEALGCICTLFSWRAGWWATKRGTSLRPGCHAITLLSSRQAALPSARGQPAFLWRSKQQP